jgi:hypothetical protein
MEHLNWLTMNKQDNADSADKPLISAGYWKTVGADTPRDRQLLMRFEPGGDIWAVRWSDDEGGWTDGDHTVFRPNYNHAQWCEVLPDNQIVERVGGADPL